MAQWIYKQPASNHIVFYHQNHFYGNELKASDINNKCGLKLCKCLLNKLELLKHTFDREKLVKTCIDRTSGV